MNEDENRAITRRTCLTAGGVAVLLGVSPALGQARLDTRLSGPPGHRREAPAFHRVDFGK